MINYGGVDLGQYLELRDIRRNILPTRENYSVDIPSMTGNIYNGFKYGERVIEVDFLVKSLTSYQYVQMLRDIATIIDVDAPCRLYLMDEPNKYYYAVIEGDTNVSEIARGVGEGTLTFVCYNPIAYSDEEKIFTGTNSVVCSNEGTTKAYPVIDINFSKTATFAQVSNAQTGAAVLVGEWPNVNQPSAPAKGNVISDPCTTLTDWLAVGNVLDADRKIDGNFTINSGGYAITPSSFGSHVEGDKWRGPARRRNLGRNVRDFEVVAEFEFDSKGKNYSNATNTPATSGETNKYRTTANLNIRTGRGTNYKILTTMPKGTEVAVTEISGGWGKVSYKGHTGYSSMNYLSLVQSTTPSGSQTNYQVDTGSSKGLILRSSRSTSSKVLLSIPNGTSLMISDISNGWGKTSYKGKTGYVYMQYVRPKTVAQNYLMDNPQISLFNTEETADDKLGLIELYGFDASGNKLFKFQLTDANHYYEYTHPAIQIGNTTVLKDTDSVPKPRTEKIKDDKGNEETVNANSGKFGKWNEFSGQIKIRRETVNNKQQWTCRVDKIQGGKVVASLSTNSLVNSNYPTGELNNLVLFIGQYGDSPTSAMTLTHLSVEQLNEVPAIVIPQIFRAGDKLTIDCQQNLVLLNDIPFMEHTDIGSNFFPLDAGDTELKIFTDDSGVYTSVSITERWL